MVTYTRLLLTNGFLRYVHDGIAVTERGSTRRTYYGVFEITADVTEPDGCGSVLLVLQRPLLNRSINLAEVVDTGVLLGRGARLDEVRDCDGRQQSDDCHDDHDFH